MSIDIAMECTGKNKLPNRTHFVVFTVADTEENRRLFGGATPTGELRLQGIVDSADYVYEQNHVLTLRGAREAQSVPGPRPPQPQQSQPSPPQPR